MVVLDKLGKTKASDSAESRLAALITQREGLLEEKACYQCMFRTRSTPTSPKVLSAKGVVAQMTDKARLLSNVRCSAYSGNLTANVQSALS